jgi:hypothetical protein
VEDVVAMAVLEAFLRKGDTAVLDVAVEGDESSPSQEGQAGGRQVGLGLGLGLGQAGGAPGRVRVRVRVRVRTSRGAPGRHPSP